MQGNLITDRVKQLVRMRGPLIPSQISKEIGTNILMASAILSELTSKGDVKISNVKVGGTPLYYVPGQEQKLQNYTSNMHQKEKEAYEQLKERGVLKDATLEPVIRVALRQIKDFAKPIEASTDGNVELFWKWYMLPNEAAEAEIKKMLGYREETATTTASATHYQATPEPMIEPVAGTETIMQPTVQLQQKIQPATAAQPPQFAQSQAGQQPTLQQTIIQASADSKLAQQARPSRKKAPAAATSDFLKLVTEFFIKNGIEAEASTAISRSEAHHVVLLPSPVGKLRYYCVAKNKKTCTDSDISSAIVQGQLKKLPVMLLTKGELTKKAQELLAKEIGALVVKKI